MRFALTAIFIFVLWLVPVLKARATGDVLLPSDANGSAPNLGLAPNADGKSDSGAKSATGSPTTSPAVLPSLAPEALPYTPIPGQTATANQPSAVPTTVIKQPDPALMAMPDTLPPPPATMSPENARLYAEAMEAIKTTSALNVVLADKSVWSVGDAGQVNDHLGIAKADVPSQCRMSLSGLLTTNRGPYAFDTGSLPQATARYNGMITGVTVRVQALCALVPLPPNKGVVIQLGDKYAVNLGGANCPPPSSPSVRKLVVLYRGGSDAQCQYH